ncbi:MAG: BTAD domain-containing putative transcriptional regulator [Actinomycetota bacterium]
MTGARIEVLGPVRARVDGEIVEVTSPTQQLVLAVLAAARPHPVTRGRLADAVWPDGAPATADNSLNSHLSRLRRALGPDAIERIGTSYRLAWPLDADELTDVAGDPGELRSRLAVWRGEPFGELAAHPFLVESAAQLTAARTATRRRLAELLVTAGELEPAVAELRTIVIDAPEDERSWTALVGLLTELDRRAEAVRVAHDARAALAEVGLVAGSALTDAEAAALASTSPDAPEPSDGLVGRDDALARLRSATARHRWVTVVGPGGVGKTRLVRAHLDRSADRSAAFCDLAAASDRKEVEITVAQAIGAAAAPPISDELVSALRRRPRLLVLDACEHRIDDVRALAELLAGLDDVRVIATSRFAISTPAEQLVELGPLAPDDAVELLRRRAGALDEAIDADEAATQICRRVDHLPLGVELASSLLRVLDPDELLGRLADTVDVLRAPDRPDRHRSLRATVEHSIELLGPVERRALLWSSTFLAAFSLDRAEELLAAAEVDRAAVPSLIASLRNASLLHPVLSPSGRRLRMLDTVRAVVADHLEASGEAGAARAAHAAVHVRAAEHIGAGIVTGEERRWASIAEAELADLRAAQRWALDVGHADAAVALGASLFQYAYDRIRPEVGAWADAALERFDLDGAAAALISATAALGAFQTGDLDRAERCAEVATTGDGLAAARAGVVLANVHLVRGDLADAEAAAAASVERAGDRPYLRGLALLLHAISAHYSGDQDTAERSLHRLEQLASHDDAAPSLTAYARYGAAELTAQADPATARRHLAASLAAARSVGNSICEGVALVTAGTLTSEDDPEAARQEFLRIIGHWSHRPDHSRQWVTLRNFAVTLARCGEHRDAAIVLGAAEAHAPPAYGAEAARIERLRVELDRELGRAAAVRLRSEGAAADLAEIVAACLGPNALANEG